MLATPVPRVPVTVDAKTKDPVCGMDVNPSTARYKSEHAGQDLLFLQRPLPGEVPRHPMFIWRRV